MARERHNAVLRLAPEVHAKLKYIAQQEGRSVNNMIEQIIRRYIAEFEREHGPIITPQEDKD